MMSAINGASNSYTFPLTFMNRQSNVATPSNLVNGTRTHQHDQAEGSESSAGSEGSSGSEGSVDVMA